MERLPLFGSPAASVRMPAVAIAPRLHRFLFGNPEM